MPSDNLEIKRKSRTGCAAKFVLTMTARVLIELAEQVEDMNFLRYHNFYDDRTVREARYDYGVFMDRKKQRLRKQAIKRLCEERYVKLNKEGDRMVMTLTTSGKVRALRSMMRMSKRYLPDNLTCLVSFDFPEAARMARNNFRWFLKGVGFKFVQGSVWATKKDISLLMAALVKLLKIGRWVEIYTVTK